jgi:hypothetical protein
VLFTKEGIVFFMFLWNKNHILEQKDEIIEWYKQKERESRTDLEQKNEIISQYQQQEKEYYQVLEQKETEYKMLLGQKEQSIQEIQQKVIQLEQQLIQQRKVDIPQLRQQKQVPSQSQAPQGMYTEYQKMEKLANKLAKQQSPTPRSQQPSFQHIQSTSFGNVSQNQSPGNTVQFNPFSFKHKN